jgi:hypothetical protein
MRHVMGYTQDSVGRGNNNDDFVRHRWWAPHHFLRNLYQISFAMQIRVLPDINDGGVPEPRWSSSIEVPPPDQESVEEAPDVPVVANELLITTGYQYEAGQNWNEGRVLEADGS